MMRAVVLLLCGIMMSGCGRSPEDRYRAVEAALPAPGLPAPEFDLPLLDGGQVSPATLAGSPVVLALWSTSCPHSISALRALGAIQREFASRGVRVVVIADDGDSARLREVIENDGADLSVAYANGQLEELFHSSRSSSVRIVQRIIRGTNFALPSFLILDPAGRIAARAIGVELGEVTLQGVRRGLGLVVPASL